MAVGRISGPLLKSNLLRNGVDLAFQTDLLYLDVSNSRIGVKTATPQYDLDVNGTTRSTDLITTGTAYVGNVRISGNTIDSVSGDLNLTTVGSDKVTSLKTLEVDDLRFDTNVISSTVSNADIDIVPNGSGKVVFKGNSTKGSGQFVLNCEQNSHGIVIKGPPHSASASYTLTLPNNIVNGQFLKTDGSGNLSWAASGTASRTTTNASTGSIAQTASANITIPTPGKTFSLLKVAISAPAYVILYTDSTSRSNDASRSEGTDPTPGSGVLTEVSTTTSGASTFLMTPAVLGWNNDSTPANQIYAKVVNKRATSGSNAITVTLTSVALES